MSTQSNGRRKRLWKSLTFSQSTPYCSTETPDSSNSSKRLKFSTPVLQKASIASTSNFNSQKNFTNFSGKWSNYPHTRAKSKCSTTYTNGQSRELLMLEIGIPLVNFQNPDLQPPLPEPDLFQPIPGPDQVSKKLTLSDLKNP